MNGEYYQNPIFPSNESLLKVENTTIFNNSILEMNKGKRINVYASFDKSFSGILELFKDNYLILSEPESSKNYLIDINHINYIEFIEKINY